MKKIQAAIVTTLALAVSGSALATMDIYKELKAKESTVTCQTCHVDKMPKKETHDAQRLRQDRQGRHGQGREGRLDEGLVQGPGPGRGSLSFRL